MDEETDEYEELDETESEEETEQNLTEQIKSEQFARHL